MANSSNNGHEELTHRQRRALPCLVSAPSYERGCKLAGIGRRTLTGWLGQATFRRALRDAEGSAYRAALAEVERGMSKAARTLRHLLRSENEGIRLRAAAEMLGVAFKAREVGAIEDRLREIEAKLKITETEK